VAEQAVSKVKKISMPAAEVMKRRRRPARSTMNEALTAQHKFQMARMPLMRSWIVLSVTPDQLSVIRLGHY
jgi:hypothetical protein